MQFKKKQKKRSSFYQKSKGFSNQYNKASYFSRLFFRYANPLIDIANQNESKFKEKCIEDLRGADNETM